MLDCLILLQISRKNQLLTLFVCEKDRHVIIPLNHPHQFLQRQMTKHVKPATPSHILPQIHFPHITHTCQRISYHLKAGLQHHFLLILSRELHGTIYQRSHHSIFFRIITHVKFRPQHFHASSRSMYQKRP